MNQTLHIAAKDFRRYRPLVLLAVGCLLVAPLVNYFGLAIGKLGPIPGSFLVEVIKWPLILLLALAIMQDDSPVGQRSFWLTRPIRPLALLGAKLLFLTALIAVPGAIAAMLLAWAVDADAVTSLAIGVEVGLTLEVGLVAAALLGALSKDVVQTGRNMFLLLAGWWLVAMSVYTFWPGVKLLPPPRTGITLASQVLFGTGLFTFSSLAIMAWFYRARRVAPAASAALIALVAAVYAGRLCPIQIVREPVTPATPSSDLVATLPKLELSPSKTGILNGAVAGYVPGRGRSRLDYVAVDTLFSAPPSDIIAEINAVTSELTMFDGTKRSFPFIQTGNSLGFRQVDQAIREAIGFTTKRNSTASRLLPLRLFTVAPDDNPAPPDRPAKLRAQLAVAYSRFIVEARMPLRAGATARLEGELWRVDQVELLEDGRVNVQARRMKATSLLHPVGKTRPDGVGFTVRNVRGFVVFNARRQEYALELEGKVTRVDFAAIMNQDMLRRTFREKFGADGPIEPNFDAAWLADAELLVLGTETVGNSLQELTIDDFVLVRQ